QSLVVLCGNASSNVNVDIDPYVPNNSSVILQTTSTVFPNPAYEDVAPCTCQLVANQCNINCCCDVACNVDDLSTFQCTAVAVDDPNLCSTSSTFLRDYHQFTCIQFLNSPDLGLYFTNFTGNLRSISTLNDYNARLGTAATNMFTFNQPTVVHNGFLTLPQSTLSGQCLRNSVVRFQNETSSVCESLVTADTCIPGSTFDLNFYLKQSTLIAQSLTSSSVVAPNITYLCDSQTNYLKTAPVLTTNTRSFFDASGSCMNAVVAVTYQITWNSSIITQVDAFITLANLTASPTDILTQTFDVKFQHFGDAANSVQRSGNPGYNIGSPVISAIATEGSLNLTNPLSLWSSTTEGLCSTGLSQAPLFGQDSLTGCLVRLSYLDFQNCSVIRNEVELQQRLLLAATNVSRFGNPNITSLNSDWIAVIDNLDAAVINDSIPGQCSSIPAYARIEFVTSQTGRIEGFPIYEVIGVRISWSRVTWQLSCSVNQACQSGSSLVENFQITSSVSFSLIDRIQSAPLTRSQLDDSTSCNKDATCWGELLLPLTSVY
uniref:Uncharacterized protein n=1 Tax=Ciona savignyi TaxID=51511 RepID=H2YYG4_CIOSA